MSAASISGIQVFSRRETGVFGRVVCQWLRIVFSALSRLCGDFVAQSAEPLNSSSSIKQADHPSSIFLQSFLLQLNSYFKMVAASSLALLLALVASPALAWLPGQHKEIYALDGTNLFNTTAQGGESESKRWLPASGKIRGVNLGSLFVFEPWIASKNWTLMGCVDPATGDGLQSEFDCVSHLGQAKANTQFQAHWDSWITQDDIAQIHSLGLNTIRVPVGYWMMESLVFADSEHFPQGGLSRLQRLCGWASDLGLYIIIDLHGAPGAQVKTNADTGQVSCSQSSTSTEVYKQVLDSEPIQLPAWSFTESIR